MQALFQAEYREVFLEIYQTDPERRLVTGIELLSPSNKRRGTKGWRLYHRKRQVLSSRSGKLRGTRPAPPRTPNAHGGQLAGQPVLPARLPKAGSAALRRLAGPFSPSAAAPLHYLWQRPTRMSRWPLQPLVDAVYARSHYDRDLDYRRPLSPPFRPVDAAWLEERLGKLHKP